MEEQDTTNVQVGSSTLSRRTNVDFNRRVTVGTVHGQAGMVLLLTLKCKFMKEFKFAILPLIGKLKNLQKT